MVKAKLILVLLALCASCVPSSTGQVANARPDAEDASNSCLDACKALAAAGCSEGTAPQCPNSLQIIQDLKMLRLTTGDTVTCDGLKKYVSTYQSVVNLGISCSGGH